MPTLNIMMFFWDGDSRILRSESCGLATSRLFSTDFLPAMTFDHSSMTYKQEFLNNRWVHNLLAAMCSIGDRALERTYWLWVGPKFYSLLSVCHLIGTYFLTTESDKRMRLLTRLYGMWYTILLYIMVGQTKSAGWLFGIACIARTHYQLLLL